jgi:hypothetical protein
VQPPEQNRTKVSQTFYEVWSIGNGRHGAHPICPPSLKKAQEEAAHAARGALLDYNGNRAPSRPIYELADDEALDDAVGDGLYITKETVDGNHQLNF